MHKTCPACYADSRGGDDLDKTPYGKRCELHRVETVIVPFNLMQLEVVSKGGTHAPSRLSETTEMIKGAHRCEIYKAGDGSILEIRIHIEECIAC